MGLLLLAVVAPAQYTPPPPTKTITFHKKPQLPAPLNEPVPPQPSFGIQPVAFQAAGDRLPPGASEESLYLQVQLEPPGPQRLFLLDSERDLFERMRQDALRRQPQERIVFPQEPVVSTAVYRGRQFPPMQTVVEPNYVCYPRLLFEQRNAERYGWDLGPFHPILSAGTFFADVVALPYHLGTAPCRKYECSAGLCLPGDPVPLMLYPPELSGTGFLTQAIAVGALLAIFP